MTATLSEYIKIYHNNGKHEKIGAGSWSHARDQAAAALSRLRHPMRGDETIEVELYQHGRRTTIESRSWREILVKMGDADGSVHLIFAFAMIAWVAAAQLVLSLGGI